MKIEIDDEVFDFLQKNAVPLLDTPNTVLRRLLLNNGSSVMEATEDSSSESPVDLRKNAERVRFVQELLEREFGGDFTVRRPYQFMFESPQSLVYIQNYNQSSEKLWYRVDKKAWGLVRDSDRPTTLCLTNPAEKFAYIIPIKDIELQVHKANWDRDYLEINIDHASSRWIELNWNIGDYLKTF